MTALSEASRAYSSARGRRTAEEVLLGFEGAGGPPAAGCGRSGSRRERGSRTGPRRGQRPRPRRLRRRRSAGRPRARNSERGRRRGGPGARRRRPKPGDSSGMPRLLAIDTEELGRVDDLHDRVVADEGHRPAERRRAGVVAVTDGVGGPVEARVLAVPEADHAVMVVTGHLGQELGAGDRRRGQLLVEARAEDDAFVVQLAAGAAELEVEPAQGRPLVAADEGGGVEARGGGPGGAGRARAARWPGCPT